jgi:hypothetical protein
MDIDFAKVVDHGITVVAGLLLLLNRKKMLSKIVTPKWEKGGNITCLVVASLLIVAGLLQMVPAFMEKKLDLDAIVAGVNAKLPMKADEATRLNKVKAEAGKRLIYDYTCISVKIANLNMNDWKAHVVPDIKQRAFNSSEFKKLLTAGVTVVLCYSDSDGKPIDEIVFLPPK